MLDKENYSANTWWKYSYASLNNMKHGSHSCSVVPAQNYNSRKKLMRRNVATWWIICSLKSWNKWIILFLAFRPFLKKKIKSIRHSQMRQADVAGEPTWGASWICTCILGEAEDTNGCFEFNICYFLPAGITYRTFAVHSAMPSKCFPPPSIFSSFLIWTFHEMKQKY